MKIYIKICVCVLWISSLVTGCLAKPSIEVRLPQPTQEKNTQSLSGLAIVSATATPKPTNTVDPTLMAYSLSPYPTMEEEPLTILNLLLHSENCVLPCYLGITPGLTTENEVKAILDSLDTYIVISTQNDGNLHYSTNVDIGDDSLIGLTQDPNLNVTDIKIVQHLDILVQNGLVQKLHTSISTTRFISRFQVYWSRYSLRKIFQSHGLPDEIYTSTIFYTNDGIGVQLIVVYEKAGIVASYRGIIYDKQICLDSINSSGELTLILTNPSSGLNLFEPELVPFTHPDIYAPIEEQLNTNKNEFYTQLISNPLACFEIKMQ